MILQNEPITVYLDQNKWIDLSRAYYGRPDGEKFIETLRLVQNAVDQGIARFPISAEHIIETIEKGDANRRKRLAHVMAELSRGVTIAPKEKITPIELEATLAKTFNQAVISSCATVFGLGIGFIWGVSQFGLSESGLPEIMQTIDKEATSELDMQANLVKGAMNSLIAFFDQPDEGLRKEITQKYNGDIQIIAENIENMRRIGKKYSKEIRYFAYITRLINDPQDSLHACLIKMGLTLNDFLDIGKYGIKAFYQAIPTLDVIIELATERDKFYDRAIDANDATDISFLSMAIPYCDIVVTENFWVSVIEKKKLDIKYKTIVLRNINDLGEHLATRMKIRTNEV